MAKKKRIARAPNRRQWEFNTDESLKTGKLYDRKGAAEYLGLSAVTLRHHMDYETLSPLNPDLKIGGNLAFYQGNLDDWDRRRQPGGHPFAKPEPVDEERAELAAKIAKQLSTPGDVDRDAIAHLTGKVYAWLRSIELPGRPSPKRLAAAYREQEQVPA